MEILVFFCILNLLSYTHLLILCKQCLICYFVDVPLIVLLFKLFVVLAFQYLIHDEATGQDIRVVHYLV